MKNQEGSGFKGALIILTIVSTGLLVFTGSYVYRRYAGLLEQIKQEIQPDFQLVQLERLNTAMLEAEANLQNFYLTGNESYARAFSQDEEEINQIILDLREGSVGNLRQLALVGQLDSNVNKLLDIYYERYLSPEDDFVKSALDRIRQQLLRESNVADSLIDLAEQDRVLDGIEEELLEDEEEQIDRRGFLQRIFGRKKKEESESSLAPENTLDTNFTEEIELQLSAMDSLKLQIEVIAREEQQRSSALKKRLLKLGRREKLIKANILQVRQKFEELEKERMQEEAKFAEAEIDKTNTWIAIILVFLFALISFASYLVYRNIERNKLYQNALNRAKSEAEELAATKSRFLANMSHELRTPLNAILGFTEQLKQANIPSEEKEQVEIVHNASTHLLDVVNEVLDYTKLSSNTIRVKFVDFNLHQELNALEKIVEQLASKKQLQLSFKIHPDVPTHLRGDIYRVKQCLLNLLGNAIKFTQEGTVALNVSVESDWEQSVSLKFTVSDTGVGIAKSDLEKIFLEFEQIENNLDQSKGTGLGLAITKRLVELMGGKINLKSSPDLGTEISLFLTFQKGEQQDAIEPATEYVNALRVLVADDEEFNRKLIATILSKHGVVFEMANNGDEALALARQSRFNAVLLDFRMPHKNGVEVIQELRAEVPHYKEIPMLIISAAKELQKDESLMKSLQPVKLLAKPFTESQLLAALVDVAGEIDISEDDLVRTQEPINWDKLKEAAGGDEQFMQEMMETFVNGARQAMQEILQALQEKNAVQLADSAHRLAPSSKHMGFHILYELLKNLEEIRDTKEINWHQVQHQVAELKQQILIAIHRVENEMSSLPE
ncbi:MAG: ATP-binding protein [Luteibaculum sp.]